ncbi:hypothetical protein Tdes44962_MAKER06616 [Teratosphaeria destructans]|uniref:Uncharacterized protein n=1 Tax=Teratosphaeria destructans TaxID=418781 RepID=A0A9W7T0Z9_9PEZI|nr:hypothetical protein Tdes44962_MAKER06616 [Teratosphaeria destructans]
MASAANARCLKNGQDSRKGPPVAGKPAQFMFTTTPLPSGDELTTESQGPFTWNEAPGGVPDATGAVP